ncbi:MAG TPA: hypothetical protein VGE18_01335 [Candidatus Paceibacterota bacterium]
MPRLPQVGGDENNWGELLNEFLEVAHTTDGEVESVGVEGLETALAGKADLVNGKIPQDSMPAITFTDFLGDGTSGNPYRFGTRNLGTYLQELPGYDAGQEQLLYNSLEWRNAHTVTVRVQITGASSASSAFAPIKYNKKLLWNWEVDDNPEHVYTTQLPYLHGGTTGQGHVFPGLTYTDGCGNIKKFDMSIAVFGNGDNTPNFFDGYAEMITLSELATIYRAGFGIMNHQFGGSGNLAADRYYQVQQQTEELYTRFKEEENIEMVMRTMVVPAADEGYTATAHAVGYLGMSSQAGVLELRDGFDYSFTGSVASIPSDFICRSRFHFREALNSGDYEEYTSYIDDAKTATLTAPFWLRGFSHGPGESNSAQFTLYTQMMDYMVEEFGDDMCALNTQDSYEYFETKGLAVKNENFDSETGILEITLDLSAIPRTNRKRDMSLLVTTNGTIAGVTVVGADSESHNTATGLINIFKERTRFSDPSLDPRHPRIVGVEVPVDHPDQVHITYDMPIAQTVAGYEVEGYTITAITVGGNASTWILQLEETVLSTDMVTLTYRMQEGDAAAASDAENLLCSYIAYAVVNNSEEVAPEDPELRISLKNGSNQQLYTCDTITELVTYMGTLNINSDLFIYFNDNAAPHIIESRWNISYSNPEYKITIRNKAGVVHPLIDGDDAIADLLRISRSNVRIEGLSFRSGKYTNDTGYLGDNYSGSIIAQVSNTADTEYVNLKFHEGMTGLKISGPNSTADQNISNILVDTIEFTHLTGNALIVGTQNLTAVDERGEEEYTMSDVIVRNITIYDDTESAILASVEGTDYYFGGTIASNGVNGVTFENITAENLGTQVLSIGDCKTVLVRNCTFKRFSLRQFGYNGAIRPTSCEGITMYNIYSLANRPLLHGDYCRDIILQRVFTAPVDAGATAGIGMSNCRRFISLKGNLAVAGPNEWACAISFDRSNGYIPTLAEDFLEEEANVWITQDFRTLNVAGIGEVADGDMFVYTDYHHPYSDFRTNYNRGLTSTVGYYNQLVLDSEDERYLADASIGRNFVASQVGSITTDAGGGTLTYPADAGAYDADAL